MIGMPKQPVLIYGEVLFDCFPDSEPVMGGAPFNVAWHLQGFGEAPRLISAVGNDELGRRIKAAMQDWGMSTEFLHTSDTYPTGVVNITLQNNEPSYDIKANCAYDDIHLTEQMWHLLAKHAFLYHGSLAMRTQQAELNLERILENRKLNRFIDVNLRSPWWQKDRVLESLDCAYCVKLNIHELVQLIEEFDTSESLSQSDWLDHALAFKTNFNIVNLVITQGEDGATMFTGNGDILNVAPHNTTSKVVDTVGAGDAFAAVMLLGLINQWDLEITMERAQEFANFIVTQRGAICTDPATYRDFKQLWNIY